MTWKKGTPIAALPGAWYYRVSTGTGQPGVSILWLGEMESLICSFCLSVAAHTLVWADPSLKYTSVLPGQNKLQPVCPPLTHSHSLPLPLSSSGFHSPILFLSSLLHSLPPSMIPAFLYHCIHPIIYSKKFWKAESGGGDAEKEGVGGGGGGGGGGEIKLIHTVCRFRWNVCQY